ncbi:MULTISPECIES: hypothetical protein [unclassified Streptomyces]|nr:MULTISPECIES: hypothetical protein [unclassified Streptomyces]MCX5287095.1 hypothetical protein [Streptomyces sp. NBC_00183]
MASKRRRPVSRDEARRLLSGGLRAWACTWCARSRDCPPPSP